MVSHSTVSSAVSLYDVLLVEVISVTPLPALTGFAHIHSQERRVICVRHLPVSDTTRDDGFRTTVSGATAPSPIATPTPPRLPGVVFHASTGRPLPTCLGVQHPQAPILAAIGCGRLGRQGAWPPDKQQARSASKHVKTQRIMALSPLLPTLSAGLLLSPTPRSQMTPMTQACRQRHATKSLKTLLTTWRTIWMQV